MVRSGCCLQFVHHAAGFSEPWGLIQQLFHSWLFFRVHRDGSDSFSGSFGTLKWCCAREIEIEITTETETI